MTTVTIQEDIADEFTWNRIETTRDEDSNLVGRFIEYDNGTTKFEDYDAIGLRRVVLEDYSPEGGSSDVKPWERIEFDYNFDGSLAFRFDLSDEGLTTTREYENGVVRRKVQEDLGEYGEASDVRAWSRIETLYDETGTIEFRYEQRDSGVQIQQYYEAGTLRQKVMEDIGPYGGSSSAKPWELIIFDYNEDGSLGRRFEERDDGVRIEKDYEDGVLRKVDQTDLGDYGEPSDARVWESRTAFYDETGTIEAWFELRDNGVTTEREYENGALRVSTQRDWDNMGQSRDVKSWDTITTYYEENGDLLAKETIFDDGDVTSFIFEDGLRSLKLEYDGDDSETWLVRETIYGEDQQVIEVNTYDTEEDVPPEYGFLDYTF